MKNIKGVICYGVAGLLSILNLAWFALDYMTVKVTGFGSSGQSVYWGLNHLADATGDTKTSFVFAVVTLVLSCLLAVTCVLGLLNSLGILKIKCMAIVNYVLAGLTLVASLLAMVFMVVAIGDVPSGAGYTTTVGTGLILPFVFAVVSLVAVIVANLHGKTKTAE